MSDRCVYGCSNPRTCEYRHDGCEHCVEARRQQPLRDHNHVASISYFCNVCVKQVAQGDDHRCVGGNW